MLTLLITILLYSDTVRCERVNSAVSELGPEQLGALASMFGVLADSSRLRILQVLRHGEARVGDIVAELQMKQPNVSKHLHVLTQAGLLGRRRDGNEVYYRIQDPMVFSLCSVACGHLRESALRQAELFAHANLATQDIHAVKLKPER